MLLRHALKEKVFATEVSPQSNESLPSDVPALLIECQHLAVLSVRREPVPFFRNLSLSCALSFERLGIQASCPVVWYVVGLVRSAKTKKLRKKEVRAALTRDCQ